MLWIEGLRGFKLLKKQTKPVIPLVLAEETSFLEAQCIYAYYVSYAYLCVLRRCMRAKISVVIPR